MNAPRPFLRKGQGTARFQQPATRRSGNFENANNRESVLRNSRSAGTLPRFTPTMSTNLPPNSARTDFDSGISNEGASPYDERDDETRPPTMSSFPTDNESHHEISPSPTSHFNSSPNPNVLEEQDLDDGASTSHDAHEELEVISALYQPSSSVPSFVESSSVASGGVSTNSSVISADQRRQREIANLLHQRAMEINTIASVSPVSSSNLSTPLGASTPITNTNTQYQNLPKPPSTMIHEHSLITPRPFSTTRANLMNQDDAGAQTGASLLHRPLPRFQLQQQQQPQNAQPQNAQPRTLRQQAHHNQKENHRPIPSQPAHVYDVPQARYTNSEKNLMVQLRDTIAHLDFAEETLRSTTRKMKEEFVKMKETMKLRYDKRKLELEEEYRRRFDELGEEQRVESERLQREKRDVERDRRILNKESGERAREQTKLIEDQRNRITELETQMAKFRHEQRTRDEKLRKKDDELEKTTKELERCKKNNQTMEKRLRQMRLEKDKAAREEEMFAKAEIRRCSRRPLSQRAQQEKEQVEVMKSAPTQQKRSVSWADSEEFENDETTDGDVQIQIPLELVMKPAERGTGEWGPFVMYRNALKDYTKMTRTAENGTLFEYKNGDKRWINSSSSIIWYLSGIDGTIQVELVNSATLFRFFVNRQFEIFRPNDMISMVNYHRNDIRTEVMHLENDYFYTELFDKNGSVTTKDMIQPDMVKKYDVGKNHSIRDNGSCYVSVHDYDDFEFVEPEFRLRYYKGAMIACKLFARNPTNEKTLKLDINPETGEGKLEAVQQYSSISGISQKKTVFTWSGPPAKF